MTWNVEWDDAAVKELRKLDKQAQRDILKYFRERIASDDDPRRFGKQLSRELTTVALPCSQLPHDLQHRRR